MKRYSDAVLAEMLGTQEIPPEAILPNVLVSTALADQFVTVAGPLGPIHVAFTPLGLSAVVPSGDTEEFLDIHSRTVGRPAYPAEEMPDKLRRALQRSLETGKTGKMPLDLRQLTAFQRGVLAVTARIPPGEVRPYGWVAHELGNDGAVRAVGSALGRNPVPLVVPCHRVVRSDGAVGNYAFGSNMKLELLEHEGVARELFEPGSSRLTGSDTTGIFCYPTCRHARRVTEKHRVRFPSVAQATAAGYRPCKVCRPV
jgi:methylated-DNA-[protein]-cysteine S-methyltransferase